MLRKVWERELVFKVQCYPYPCNQTKYCVDLSIESTENGPGFETCFPVKICEEFWVISINLWYYCTTLKKKPRKCFVNSIDMSHKSPFSQLKLQGCLINVAVMCSCTCLGDQYQLWVTSVHSHKCVEEMWKIEKKWFSSSLTLMLQWGLWRGQNGGSP